MNIVPRDLLAGLMNHVFCLKEIGYLSVTRNENASFWFYVPALKRKKFGECKTQIGVRG